MAEITASAVKALREKTSAGMMECKAALVEANGDENQAVEILRKKGLATAGKKEGRVTAEGAVGSYIHMGGKVGVMVEVALPNTSKATHEHFATYIRDLTMHIAAASPQFLKPEEVPADVVAKEKEIALAQLQGQNKPADVLEKIAAGKINKYFEESCLVKQKFVKDDKKTIDQLTAETGKAMGETIHINRFTRFLLGEGVEVAAEETQH